LINILVRNIDQDSNQIKLKLTSRIFGSDIEEVRNNLEIINNQIKENPLGFTLDGEINNFPEFKVNEFGEVNLLLNVSIEESNLNPFLDLYNFDVDKRRLSDELTFSNYLSLVSPSGVHQLALTLKKDCDESLGYISDMDEFGEYLESLSLLKELTDLMANLDLNHFQSLIQKYNSDLASGKDMSFDYGDLPLPDFDYEMPQDVLTFPESDSPNQSLDFKDSKQNLPPR